MPNRPPARLRPPRRRLDNARRALEAELAADVELPLIAVVRGLRHLAERRAGDADVEWEVDAHTRDVRTNAPQRMIEHVRRGDEERECGVRCELDAFVERGIERE